MKSDNGGRFRARNLTFDRAGIDKLSLSCRLYRTCDDGKKHHLLHYPISLHHSSSDSMSLSQVSLFPSFLRIIIFRGYRCSNIKSVKIHEIRGETEGSYNYQNLCSSVPYVLFRSFVPLFLRKICVICAICGKNFPHFPLIYVKKA